MSRRLLAVLGAVVAVGAAATPAAAHPFGPPPTAQVTVDGAQVTIDWSATPDDAVAIGELLGLMPANSTAAYRQDSAAQVAPSRADEAAFSASPKLHDYLTEHIVILQGGQPCAATVPPIPDFVHQGGRIMATCPAPISEIDLRITMLHSIHPAYRTFAVGEGSDPGQSVFTVEAPQHTWRFGAAAAQRRTPWGAMLLGGAVSTVLTGVVAAVMVNRRRKRP